MIINMSGGGASLNFSIIGGTSTPLAPSNNMIWVKTSTEITSWIFSSTEPKSPTRGMVWFATGKTSRTAFNVLKNNTIEVYPVSAKQYNGSTWVNCEANTYMNNKWVSWALYVFISGDQCEDVTGGWTRTQRSTNINPITPSLTIENGTMTVKSYDTAAANYYGGTVQTNNKIDMTPYTTLMFNITDFINEGGRLAVGVTSDATSAYYGMDAYSNITAIGEVTVDVSAVSKECVIAINPMASGQAKSTASITTDEIYLL
jgi:hypothetical protein